MTLPQNVRDAVAYVDEVFDDCDNGEWQTIRACLLSQEAELADYKNASLHAADDCVAKDDMRRWFINLPDADLAYIPEGSQLFGDYREALEWAQQYARLNRELMMDATLAAISSELGRAFDSGEQAVNCHHNYVAWERHFGENVMLTRKGAVSAKEGELGIIPGSMGAKSFIVRGKGNRESFCSCSHGAGRSMSRTEARKRFTIADHEAATAGVECRKDAEVIDETPAAYKSIDAVMAAQSDLVEIVHTLKQIVCVKG